MEIPLSYNVSTSLSAGVTQVAEPNANVLCLMTNEPSSFTYDNGEFFNSTDVAKYWGSDSTTFAMANAALSQTPGIKAGNGYVQIVKMKNTTDGTPVKFETESISSKIDAFKLITDGSFTMSINGDLRKSVFMDFSSVNTVSDIATIMNQKAYGYTVSADEDTGIITISTKIVGSVVIFVNAAVDAGNDLADATLLNMATATKTDGTDPEGETVEEVLTRLDGGVFFHGIVTTKVMPTAEKIATAEALFGQRYLFYPDIAGMQEAKEVGEEIVSKSLWNTRLATNLDDEILTAKKLAAGCVSKMFSANPNMSNVALTMDNKIIAGVSGSDKVGSTELSLLLNRGVDVYTKRTAVLSTLITGNINKYTDVAYLSNLIQMLLEVNVFNIFLTDTKVSQTDVGRRRIKKAIADTLDKLVRANWLAAGETWNGDTFGNEAEFLASMEINGYYIYLVPEVTQADREKRTAVVQIACKASGAYHKAQIKITLEE